MQKQKLITFIDAEISSDGKIMDIGAVRGSGDEFRKNGVGSAVEFLRGAEFVAWHNLVSFDLLYLKEILDTAGVKKFIDTLYLSPLLFPIWQASDNVFESIH